MNETAPIEDILKGIDEISDAVRLSRPVTLKMIAMGMPGFKVDGQWYASRKAIEKFFYMRSLVAGRSRAK